MKKLRLKYEMHDDMCPAMGRFLTTRDAGLTMGSQKDRWPILIVDRRYAQPIDLHGMHEGHIVTVVPHLEFYHRRLAGIRFITDFARYPHDELPVGIDFNDGFARATCLDAVAHLDPPPEG